MKAQISRDSQQPDKRYVGVYQQQGRMITDADWNELCDVLKRRHEQALSSLVGSGVPRGSGLLNVNDSRAQPGQVVLRPELRWGEVVVDGIGAEVAPDSGISRATFNYAGQRDFPHAPPLSTGAHTLYVDVWERLVVSIQDSALRDPALHGADTCVRTEVLAQVKFCPDPSALGSAVNPSRGNARFALERIVDTADRDDPCATATVLTKDLGNYLFRLEVHDVEGPANAPTAIVLKWSAENGAEAHAVGSEPLEFKSANYLYEFFSETTERHLGVSLSGPLRRSVLALSGYPETIPLEPSSGSFPFVRRWDGYCRLEKLGGNLKFVAGRYLGRPIEQSSVTGLAETGTLAIQLGELKLSLELRAKTCVAGDYWYALLRGHPGALVEPVVSSAEPVGIVHHYLRLLSKDAVGAVVYPATPEQARALSFPPLTNITADRVGYDPSLTQARWLDVNDTPTGLPSTVQDALDQLAFNLEASDIGYSVPSCAGMTTVRSLLSTLSRWPDLDSDTHTTLKDMLDALLCHLDATRIPYATSSAGTVGDAIEARVKKAGDSMTGDLTVQASVRITEQLGVGTATPGAKVAINGGLHVGGDSDPGNDNLLVDGRANVQGGLSVGASSDPGAGNLTVSGNGSITGNLTVSGNLTVDGTTTTLNTSELAVEDKIIRVNKYAPQSTPLPGNAGLEVFRGGEAVNPNAQLVWDEAQDHWMHGVEGNLRPIGGGQPIVTGVVRFGSVGRAQRISPEIDPGLGAGPLCVVLGETGLRGFLASDPTTPFTEYGDEQPRVLAARGVFFHALVNEASGRFRIAALNTGFESGPPTLSALVGVQCEQYYP